MLHRLLDSFSSLPLLCSSRLTHFLSLLPFHLTNILPYGSISYFLFLLPHHSLWFAKLDLSVSPIYLVAIYLFVRFLKLLCHPVKKREQFCCVITHTMKSTSQLFSYKSFEEIPSRIVFYKESYSYSTITCSKTYDIIINRRQPIYQIPGQYCLDAHHRFSVPPWTMPSAWHYHLFSVHSEQLASHNQNGLAQQVSHLL